MTSPDAVAATASSESTPHTPADLFQVNRVWTAHFRFTPDQWKAMDPKSGGKRAAGGPGGPRPAALGPVNMLASSMLRYGDRNRDGRLAGDEFRALAERWFEQWDRDQGGRLNADQLRAGLVLALDPVGAAGGRGVGFSLQGAEGARNGLASAMGIEFNYVHADLEFAGTEIGDVAIRYKGNGTFMDSRNTRKHSLKVDFNEFAKGQKLAGVSKLNFHNNVTDASWMNEVLSYRLYRDAGVPAPRTAYARVYITVPGKCERQYLGLYSIVENIDNDLAKDRFGTKKGAIFKPVTPGLFADLGDDWKDYRQTYDPKDDVSADDAQRVIEFCRLVTHANDAEFAARVGDYLDLHAFSRFMSVTVYLSTLDSILAVGQNYYLYLHPTTRKFQFIPWDLDHSFGQFPLAGNQEQRENLSIHKPWAGQNRFLERVFKVEAFKKLYLARLEEFSRTIFTPDRFHQQVDEIATAIRPAVLGEPKERLVKFDKAVAGQPPVPGGFLSRPVKPIKSFVKARTRSVLDQLAGKNPGQIIGTFGFGGFGGQAGIGASNTLARAILKTMDRDKDGQITREEFTHGFGRWFETWNAGKSNTLTEEQLRAGINKDLLPAPGGPGNRGAMPQNGPSPRPSAKPEQ